MVQEHRHPTAAGLSKSSQGLIKADAGLATAASISEQPMSAYSLDGLP